MNVEQIIREYLTHVTHLSLATSKDNKPWVCEVHFVYDDSLNLYFRSNSKRRHSVEITSNPHVAGNIIREHEVGEKPQGVYFEGIAEMLSNVDEQHPAYIASTERFGHGPAILEAARTEDGSKFYKIAVDTFYLFDAKESSPSQKYELVWGKK